MIFKVTYRFNGETCYKYYKARDLSVLYHTLFSYGVYMLTVFEIKRLLRVPKGVEPIEL